MCTLRYTHVLVDSKSPHVYCHILTCNVNQYMSLFSKVKLVISTELTVFETMRCSRDYFFFFFFLVLWKLTLHMITYDAVRRVYLFDLLSLDLKKIRDIK